MSIPVLVVDDDQSMCEMVAAGLVKHGFSVTWRTTGREGIETAVAGGFETVITDLNLTRTSGLEVCRRLTESVPDLPVIVVTAFGDMSSAIAAIRAGAYDFINKPVEMTALAHALRRAVQHRQLGQEVRRLSEAVKRAGGAGELVGKSAPMKRVYDLVRRVSEADASVLITGESGTGKELVARALHTECARAKGPFVPLNCAAIPAPLLESELFGHKKGAFTDAKTDRKGIFEQAEGGTVLLDEVGEMPLDMQPKLLRVLQDREVRPVGSNQRVAFNARVVAATNRDLETDVEEGRFREDLYYRLNVVQIHVPPLRARGNDILLLAQHFIEQVAERSQKPVEGLSSEAAKRLLEYDWPGNVRQLENWMERAVTLTKFDHITVDDLPDKVRKSTGASPGSVDVDFEHMLTLEELEQRYIERVLKATHGNKTQAAKVLGLDRRTLYRKLERYERGS